MKKIKKVSEHTSHQYTTTYEVDCGMFQVDVEAYSSEFELAGLSNKLLSCEIQDMDFEFNMDGKRCDYEGFKELYNKLYGEGSYLDFNEELTNYIEREHHRLASRPYIQNINCEKATEYLSELLTRSTYATGTTMLGSKEILYADKWPIIELAKIAEPDKVHLLKCKRTNGSSDKEYQHSIFDLDAYWSGQ